MAIKTILKRAALFSLLISCLSARAELQVYSRSNVFGLAPTASPADFAMTLGQPSAELPLHGERRGLLYGNSLMLVFEGDRLREVRCWLVPRFTGDLYLGWLQEVPARAGLEGFVLDDRLRLGMPREEAESALAGLEGAATSIQWWRSSMVSRSGWASAVPIVMVRARTASRRYWYRSPCISTPGWPVKSWN